MLAQRPKSMNAENHQHQVQKQDIISKPKDDSVSKVNKYMFFPDWTSGEYGSTIQIKLFIRHSMAFKWHFCFDLISVITVRRQVDGNRIATGKYIES